MADGAAMSGPNDWLDHTHPVYDAWVERWTENERRLRGGDYVLSELRRFRWETLPGMTVDAGLTNVVAGEHYLARQQQATYVNFPDMFALAMKGHMFRNRPIPGTGLNFGNLGEVRRARDLAQPTNAELIYYNADGVGNDGSQWDNFFLSAWVRASATGHRWLFVEAPRVPAKNQQEVIDGARPYLVEYAPQQVTNWCFTNGRLDWAVVRIAQRNPTVGTDGTLTGNNPTDLRLLLVRAGVTALGTAYQGGGWWIFDEDLKLTDQQGTWQATRGQIPLWPFFYERDNGVVGSVKNRTKPGTTQDWRNLLLHGDTATRVAMSRPATTELGQLAVAFMNMLSASDFDAWDAASSVRFLLGVDKEGYNLAAGMWDNGSQTVPVPATKDGNIPQLQDGSTGAVTAEVFDKSLQRAVKLAEKIAVQEVSGTPDASGMSKRMGFGELKAPRLANIASELEQAQNTAIHFLEQRWGFPQPKGSTTWKRDFEIADVVADIAEFFDVEKVAGLSSPTLDSRLMMRAAKARGFTTDDADEQKIEKEFMDAAVRNDQLSQLTASMGGGGGSGGSGKPLPPDITPIE